MQALHKCWPACGAIRDRTTADLVSHFYEEMLRRRFPPDAALRAAQNTMRRDPKWDHPYYWAAFVPQGAR